MNTVKYNSSNKTCSSCDFWVGNRTLTKNQEFVVVNPDQQGTCFGKYKNKIKSANDKLSCWTRWSLLNENHTKYNILAELQETINNSNY